MKKILILGALLAAASSSAMAADVTGARVSADRGTLEVDVVYGGGCGDKKFKLEVSPQWSYTSPLVGNARIVETGFDACEALIRKTLVFSLQASGLAHPRYRAASLTVHGESNSSATVTLPYQL